MLTALSHLWRRRWHWTVSQWQSPFLNAQHHTYFQSEYWLVESPMSLISSLISLLTGHLITKCIFWSCSQAFLDKQVAYIYSPRWAVYGKVKIILLALVVQKLWQYEKNVVNRTISDELFYMPSLTAQIYLNSIETINIHYAYFRQEHNIYLLLPSSLS